MPRLLFEKTGNAVWISHLDLMRLFQRAFQRAGLSLTHTQGYNPRPSVSIALPLSVGVESKCELLDFALNGDPVSNGEILSRLNEALISGVKVLAVYDQGRKLKELAYLDCSLTLEYDQGVPVGTREEIAALFARDSVPVEKKGKNGLTQQDLIPLLRSVAVRQTDRHALELLCTVRCQNPALNPMQLHAAIRQYLPALAPDFVKCRRVEIYDETNTVFR